MSNLNEEIASMLSGNVAGQIKFEGGGGTSNYNDLLNKPKINNVELTGNKTTDDLGLFDGDYNNLNNKPTIPPAPVLMVGATSETDGASGYVPQPLISDVDKFLNGSGEWATPPSSSVNYSTDEQIIGTWIDGKPIYRKTLYFADGLLVQNNTWVSVGIVASSLNIERFIKGFSMGGVNTAGGSAFNINVGIVNSNISVYCDRNGDTIFIEYLTMEYTKITD